MPSADAHDLLRRRVQESIDAKRRLLEDDALAADVVAAAETITIALGGGRKVLVLGNGGSFSQAEHMAGELVGRYLLDRPGLPAFALGENAAALTAIANDDDYVQVFARQVRAFTEPGDVIVALSTSGGSKNVLEAVRAAREGGCPTIGLTGAAGGALAEEADLCIRFPSTDTPRIQEGHELAIHIICELVERDLFGA